MKCLRCSAETEENTDAACVVRGDRCLSCGFEIFRHNTTGETDILMRSYGPPATGEWKRINGWIVAGEKESLSMERVVLKALCDYFRIGYTTDHNRTFINVRVLRRTMREQPKSTKEREHGQIQ